MCVGGGGGGGIYICMPERVGTGSLEVGLNPFSTKQLEISIAVFAS